MTLRDASALIALINRGDANHDRCVNSLGRLPAPLVTTWSCFTEAMHFIVLERNIPKNGALAKR
jgi:uncharacterized protein